MTRKQATNQRVLTRGETAAKRSCAHLQKQLDEALAEIETLNRSVEVLAQERETLRDQNLRLHKEADRLGQVCRNLRYQRDEAAGKLHASISNTEMLKGFIHGLCVWSPNPNGAKDALTHIPPLNFMESDDEIPF